MEKQLNSIDLQRDISGKIDNYFRKTLVWSNSYQISDRDFSVFDVYCLMLAQQYIEKPITYLRNAHTSSKTSAIIPQKLGFKTINLSREFEKTSLAQSNDIQLPTANRIVSELNHQISSTELEESIIEILTCIFEINFLQQLRRF